MSRCEACKRKINKKITITQGGGTVIINFYEKVIFPIILTTPIIFPFLEERRSSHGLRSTYNRVPVFDDILPFELKPLPEPEFESGKVITLLRDDWFSEYSLNLRRIFSEKINPV